MTLEEIIQNRKYHKIIFYIVEDDLDEFSDRAYRKISFSFDVKNSESKKYNVGDLVIIEADSNCYVAKIVRKRSATSSKKEIVLSSVYKISALSRISDFSQHISNRVSLNGFNNKISSNKGALSKGQCIDLLTLLYEKDKDILISLVEKKEIGEIAHLQIDAIKFAMSIAKLDKTFELVEVASQGDEYSQISQVVKIYEDRIIEQDVFSDRDNLKCIDQKMLTGKAVFKNNNEKLSIYTANKNRLENMFGVDLIYINEIHNNTVMIQYKMLTKERDNGDFIYRPDSNMQSEVERMDRVNQILQNKEDSSIDEYRLNSNPFYLRFVKDKPEKDQVYSFILSLEHYKKIIELPISSGPRGGKYLSFEMMNKHYIGKSELEGLIRSGYIGTYSVDSNKLKEVINHISLGDNNNAIVLAFKEKLETADNMD